MLIVADVERVVMNVFTVSLFGHRKIDDIVQLNDRLVAVIKELMQTKAHINFLVGRNGEFDEYAASVIKRIQKEFGKESSSMILVIPYTVSDIEYYEKYYDDIIVPDSIYNAHPKSAITLKNRWMIEQSELVIVNVKRDSGGAYAAMKYAEKLNKKVINVSQVAKRG